MTWVRAPPETVGEGLVLRLVTGGGVGGGLTLSDVPQATPDEMLDPSFLQKHHHQHNPNSPDSKFNSRKIYLRHVRNIPPLPLLHLRRHLLPKVRDRIHRIRALQRLLQALPIVQVRLHQNPLAPSCITPISPLCITPISPSHVVE